MSQDFNDSRVNPAFSEISLTPSPDDHPPTRNEKENLKKVSVRLNVNYLKSLMGILTLIEMFLGLLVCCIVNASSCTSTSNICAPPLSTSSSELSGIGYIIFVGVVCIIGNLVFVIIHLKKAEFNRNLNLSEFAYSVAACALYFIATCVQTWYSTLTKITVYSFETNPYRIQWIIVAVLCWILFLSYLFKCVWSFPFRSSQ